MSQINVAIIGAGSMAAEHAKAFSGLEGVRLCGAQSRTETRAHELATHYPSMAVFATVRELFDGTHADLVVVTVNAESMRDVALQCIEYPWTVLLEKPAGLTLAEATEIRDAVERRGAKVYVALNRRALSSTRQVLARLEQAPEEQRFVTVLDQQDMDAAMSIHGHPENVARNLMYANSIHLIDYFSVLCRGHVTRVDKVIPWNPDAPCMVVAKIDYSSGDCGLYQGNWCGPGPWAVSVAIPSRRLEMRPLEQATEQLRGERTTTAFDVDPADVDFKPGFRHQALMAVAATTDGEYILPDVGESFATMQLISEIFNQEN